MDGQLWDKMSQGGENYMEKFLKCDMLLVD